MRAVFAAGCKLSESEKAAIKAFIKPGETACTECGIRSICDGPDRLVADEKKMFENAKDTCLICGKKASALRPSKLIPGTFSTCVECPDEFVFEPTVMTKGSPLDDMPF